MPSVEPIGPYLRRLRKAEGWSQSEAASHLCDSSGRTTVTKHEWSRWERGERTPTEWLPELARLFDVPLAHLEAAVATVRARDRLDAHRLLTDVIPSEDLLAELSARTGRRIGSSTVTNLSARAHSFRLADDLLAGGDLFRPAVRELNAAVRLAHEATYRDDLRPRLLSAVGELAQIVGWIVSDAGHPEQAESIYRLGVSAAREAGDKVLAANLIGSLAYQTANTGDSGRAVEMALAAYDEAGSTAPPRARALALDRIAWALAQDGPRHDAQESMRALGEASEALDEHEQEEDPGYLYWVDAGELQVMEARTYTELHRPLRAVPLLTDVLKRYDATHARELALYLSWLVVALADANEPEHAATAAEQMLELSADLPSQRTTDRSALVLTRLDEFRQVPRVRAVLDAYADGAGEA